MLVISHWKRVETDLELKFFLRFQNSRSDVDLENTFLPNLFVLEFPLHFFLVNVADSHVDELGVASVWLSHDFPFEVNQGRLKQKLRVDTLAFYKGSALDLNWFFNIHWNFYFIFSSLFREKLSTKAVALFRFQHKSVFPQLVLVLLGDLLSLRFTIVELVLVNLLSCQILSLGDHFIRIFWSFSHSKDV